VNGRSITNTNFLVGGLDIFVETRYEGDVSHDAQYVKNEWIENNRYAAVVKDKNPRQWWNINGHRFPNLAHLAKVVFNFPTSSASTERSFSANSFIHSKLRNRMCEETSNKLTYIKLNVDKAIPKDIHGRPLYQFNIGDSDDDDSM
jgi:hypothetical protein